MQVHQLVLEEFSSTPKNSADECRHLDGVPTNNRASNLSWGTRKQNIDDYIKHNGRSARAKLTRQQAEEIRSKYDGSRGSKTRLAKEYGLELSSMTDLIEGKSYKEFV